jgi:hypothetical protein
VFDIPAIKHAPRLLLQKLDLTTSPLTILSVANSNSIAKRRYAKLQYPQEVNYLTISTFIWQSN